MIDAMPSDGEVETIDLAKYLFGDADEMPVGEVVDE